MFSPSRRSFFGASLAGLASTPLFAADKPAAIVPERDEFAFQPNTLFLTWQRDPTTTMTVQWVGTAGETADTHGLLRRRRRSRPLAGRSRPRPSRIR